MKQNYSIWKQVSYYQKGAIDTSKEVLPVHSLLAINPKDERHFEIKDDVVNFNTLMHNIETGNITQLDKTIVCIVAFSEYSTIKQISEILTLIGIDFSESMLNSSIKRLHKNTLVLISRIAEANVKIVSLDKNGSEIAKRLDVPHTWNAFQRVDEPWKIKTILCCNQLRNAYLKSSLPIKWFKVREKLSTNDVTVRPSFATQIGDSNLLFEVVRQREGWKSIFIEKVLRYNELFKDFKDNSWNLTGERYLVINGENFQHNYDIFKVLEELDLDILPNVLFTEDLLQFGERFKKSLYTIGEDGTVEYLHYNVFSK